MFNINNYTFLNIYMACFIVTCIIDIVAGSQMSFKHGPVNNVKYMWERFNHFGRILFIVVNLPILCLILPFLVLYTILFSIGTIIKEIYHLIRKVTENKTDLVETEEGVAEE